MRRGRFKFGSFLAFTIFVLLVVTTLFVLTSSKFEKDSPTILASDKIYWNLKSPLNIKFKDDSGIKFVRIGMSDGQNEVSILSQKLDQPIADFDVNITIPRTGFFSTKDAYTMNIEAVDASKWNFFRGNVASKNVQVIIDSTRPEIYTVANSYSISKGGAAVVVFKATDNNLKELYVQTNYGKKFKATPFHKPNYYASLVVWPVSADNFSADIIATDNAGNEGRAHIRYFYENIKYKKSTINLKDNFLDGKIAQLTDIYAKDPASLDRLAKMKFINETLRDENDAKIKQISSQIGDQMISEFKINPFYPLKNGKKVADFADHRFYVYNSQQVSSSWHMGLDLASVAGAAITTSNDGVVAFVGDNGIYGLNVIIDHGFGFYSLYAHCSSVSVKQGQQVSAGQKIANTGLSGLALGDHLHFGILIQGLEVRPQQWLDKKWIKDNITSVLSTAKDIIDKQ